MTYARILTDMIERSLYETRGEPPLAWAHFRRRMRIHFSYALAIIVVSLAMGMIGYHILAGDGWIDAFLDTSMLLGGMGPMGPLKTNAAKIFAGMFALYSGLVFLAVTILLLTPVFHRVLHKFHWEKSHHDDA
jgi:hypothetical protein